MKKAKEAGTNIEELREKARIRVITQIMISQYIYTAVNLTPYEIYDYYQKNLKEFSTDPQVRLQLLLIGKQHKDQKRIKQELHGSL